MLLHTMLAYFILITALCTAACVCNTCFFWALNACFVIIYVNAFCFHALFFGYSHYLLTSIIICHQS